MLSRLGPARAAVRQVRAELVSMRKLHGRWVSDMQVNRVLLKVGTVGVAADAIAMWPRPAWVEAICGPYPGALELANPEDVATVEEWGHSG